MKFDKKEKKFWKHHYNVNKPADVPQFKSYTGIDSDQTDNFIMHFTKWMPSLEELHFRCTNITNEGVGYISKLPNLKKLTLQDHFRLTEACFSDLANLNNLEYLDLSRNDFDLKSFSKLGSLKKLQELHLSSRETPEEINQHILALKKVFPECNIYVNHELY